MIDKLFWSIYVADIWVILLAILILLALWAMLVVVLKSKKKPLSIVIAVISVVTIVYATLVSRNEVVLAPEIMPFASFFRAIEQPDVYRSMFMNVVLFLPLGLALPFVIKGNISKRVFLTMLAGFILSVSIEATQYIFSLGLVETDDVICNTLGVAVGGCGYFLSLLITKLRGKHKNGGNLDE